MMTSDVHRICLAAAIHYGGLGIKRTGPARRKTRQRKEVDKSCRTIVVAKGVLGVAAGV